MDTSIGARAPRVRGERLRGPILKRAGELASIDGLEQVSIGRLAESMEMSKSGLYAYFTSKMDLQLATIESAWLVFEEHVLEPPGQPIGVLLERWISYYEREVFPGGCLFDTATMEFANRRGEVHDALAAALERQLVELAASVEHAHATAPLRVEVDPRQLAFELHALLVAGNQRFRITRDPSAFAFTRTAIGRLLEPATRPPSI